MWVFGDLEQRWGYKDKAHNSSHRFACGREEIRDQKNSCFVSMLGIEARVL